MFARFGVKLLVGVFLFVLGATAPAHTLPISFLEVVPDHDYVHLELTFNPFELNFFSDLDENKDGQLNAAELEKQQASLTDRVLHEIELRVNGKILQAENAGITQDDSHHLTLRAHYRANVTHAKLTITSRLNDITSASHLTEVSFGSGTQPQLAKLDSQSREAVFDQSSRPAPLPVKSIPEVGPGLQNGFLALLLFAVLPTAGAGVLMFLFARKHWREPTTAEKL